MTDKYKYYGSLIGDEYVHERSLYEDLAIIKKETEEVINRLKEDCLTDLKASQYLNIVWQITDLFQVMIFPDYQMSEFRAMELLEKINNK